MQKNLLKMLSILSKPLFWCMKRESMCLCICSCLCAVYRYTCACLRTFTEAISQGQMSASIFLQLCFCDRVCHGARTYCLARVVSEPHGSSCLCLTSTGITSMSCPTFCLIFMWVLGIQAQVSMLIWQVHY